MAAAGGAAVRGIKGRDVKKALRQAMRATIATIPAEIRHGKSVAACTRLLETPEYRDARTIMIYLSTPTEVDTSGIALDAWRNEKRVAAPKAIWDERRMVALEIRSLSSGLHTVQMGILEPVDGEVIPVSALDLVIVPGLAFDESGNRLGRGQGYYDRFLGQTEFRGVPCAIAYEEQFVTAVPHDDRDVRVRMLVTDAHVRKF
jgi:5-formyltetrahydrofolate cyclo-ligase